MNDPVELTLTSDGKPASMQWEGREYEVIDTPTSAELVVYFITHPPPARPGWRFIGRAQEDVKVFDVFRNASGTGWTLVDKHE